MKVFHQQAIRENNLKSVISLVRRNSISRAQIAKQTNLSKTTVSSLVEELIEMDYLLDSGEVVSNKQGRRPNSLQINSQKLGIIVVNWQPNQIEAALVDLKGDIVSLASNDFTQNYAEATFLAFNQLCRHTDYKILSLCVVFPGSIEKSGRFLTTVLSLPENNSIIPKFKELFPFINVAFFNDTACIAYSEKLSFSNKNQTYIYVNMSKGIGAILFNEGKLLRTANGMTTQFGHFSVDRNGVECECGSRGCLEKIIGEKAISKLAGEYEIDDSEINYAQIGKKVAEGNKAYSDLLDEMAKTLAHAISNMVTVYNVPEIIIGGKAMLLGPAFLNKVDFFIKESGFRRFTSTLEVAFSKFPLDHKAELSGAAQYYFDMHHSFFNDSEYKIYF